VGIIVLVRRANDKDNKQSTADDGALKNGLFLARFGAK
jgi:hypothetical protein